MRRVIVLIACSVALGGTAAFAQSANPLSAPLPPNRYGVEFGASINQQSGSFESDCGCTFPTGSGVSFFGGAVWETHLTPRLAFMARATMNIISLTSKNALDTLQLVLENGKIDTSVVPLNEEATTRLTYFEIAPMLRFDILKTLFVAAGPAVGIAMANTLEVNETIAQPGLTFTGGNTILPIYNNSIPSLSTIRISVMAMLGYEIDITPKLTFIPTAAADIPLTSVTSGSTWKIAYYQLAGAVRWKVHI